jgi:hypothetical protein
MIDGMRTLLDEDRVFVTYATAAVFSGDDPDEAASGWDAFWAGQTNGLCGAAVSGVLKLTVATHTGWIPFRIELHDGPPAAGDVWEEIVEVSFVPAQEDLYLQGLDAENRYPLTLPVNSYRARFCARGFDDAAAGEEGMDAYLIQFWPAESSPDRIVRQTSAEAAYWHRYRHEPTESELEEEESLRQSAAESLAERERWGDRVPGERLRKAKGTFVGVLSQLDVDLEFSLADQPDDVLRRITYWVTLRRPYWATWKSLFSWLLSVVSDETGALPM